jgi:signal transduction histidine kinase/CheY-like chemotaxis protein
VHTLKRYSRRINRPLIHGVTAGLAVWVISSLGLFYIWHAAREAQIDAVRSELRQLARTAATLVNGDLHRTLRSQDQAGSAAHLALLEPLVRFHKATSDIIYVYTAILEHGRVYFVLGTDYLYRVPGDNEPPDRIMAPHDTFDPTLRGALERREATVDQEPVKEAVRSYMSAYAPFYDSTGRFVGVLGVDMWVRDLDARIAAIRRAGTGALIAVTLLSILAGVVVVRLSLTAHRARLNNRAVQGRLTRQRRQAEIRAGEAQAAAKAKADFLAVMSHEMRTPMSGVLGFANLLLDTPLNPEQHEFVQTVRRSGDALLTVINDVLDYSKIEAGRMTIERIGVPLREVCEGVRSILKSAAQQRGIAVEVAYEPSLPPHIEGDPVRIRQVLLNLAGNAVKFTERGSVRIAADKIGPDRVKISVTDTGIGIPPEQMATLFQRYAQGESSRTRRFGGTGLGLAISKTLVELMGGEIGVTSSTGAGSTFWFTLPLVAAQAPHVEPSPPPVAAVPAVPAPAPVQERAPPLVIARARTPTPSRAPSHPLARQPGSRLLLVEDNFVNQRVALYMLAKLGFEVDVAKNGREAVDKLIATPYALVLMDCQMPEMDGFEATKLVRDAGSPALDRSIPIIAMTANAFPEDRARALACGMNDFLSKPVDQLTLSAMIEKWLRKAQESDAGSATRAG